MVMDEITESEFELDCDLVLLALGFLGPEPDGIVAELGLKLDQRGNIACDNYHSSVPGVFGRAIRGVDNRWWFGRYGKGASVRVLSTHTWWASRTYPRARSPERHGSPRSRR